MVRNFPSSTSKDATVLHKDFAVGRWREYLYALGMCGLSLTEGIPVLMSYYQTMIRAGKPGHCDLGITGMTFLANGLSYTGRGITPQARYSFWKAFGVLPQLQEAREQYYDGFTIGTTDVLYGEIGHLW